MKAIALACAVAACAADAPAGGDSDSEPVLDGKGDGTVTPIPQGTVSYGTPQPLAFPDGTAGSVVYVVFELTGDAAVTIGAQADVDTRLYIYHPTTDAWGRSIAH